MREALDIDTREQLVLRLDADKGQIILEKMNQNKCPTCGKPMNKNHQIINESGKC